MQKAVLKKYLWVIFSYLLGIITPLIIFSLQKYIDKTFYNKANDVFSIEKMTEYFPLSTGNIWHYYGSRKCTAQDNSVITTKFNIAMEVLEVKKIKNLTFIVIEGGPLVFPYSDNCIVSQSEFSIPKLNLVIVGNKIFSTNGTQKEFDNPVQSGVLTDENLIFEFPLFKGAKFGEIKQIGRPDNAYVWHVEKELQIRTNNIPTYEPAFLLAQRAVGWFDEIIFQPYVGIVESKYFHRGTVDEFSFTLSNYSLKK